MIAIIFHLALSHFYVLLMSHRNCSHNLFFNLCTLIYLVLSELELLVGVSGDGDHLSFARLQQVGNHQAVAVGLQRLSGLRHEQTLVRLELEADDERPRHPMPDERRQHLRDQRQFHLRSALRRLQLVFRHGRRRDVEVGDCGGQVQHGVLAQRSQRLAAGPQKPQVFGERREWDLSEQAVSPDFL